MAEQNLATFERILQVNLIAPLALMQLALPLLMANGGTIVNVSSDAAQGAYPGWGGYGASKAALESFTRSLTAELGHKGITSTVLYFPMVRTEMSTAT